MFARSLFGMTALLLIATSAGAAADGAAIFKAQCAKCHGDTGKSDTAIGKSMKVPALEGDAKIAAMSAAEIAGVIKGNAKHPAAIKSLSDDDVNAVAAFVKDLAGK
jgi:mono/diheme cytochrome c family protein